MVHYGFKFNNQTKFRSINFFSNSAQLGQFTAPNRQAKMKKNGTEIYKSFENFLKTLTSNSATNRNYKMPTFKKVVLVFKK